MSAGAPGLASGTSSRCASSSTKSNRCSCAIGCWSAATSRDVDDRIPHGFQDIYPTYSQEGHLWHDHLKRCGRCYTSQYIGHLLIIFIFILLFGAFIPLWIPWSASAASARRSSPPSLRDGAKHAHPTDALSFGFPRYSYLLSRCGK